VDGRGSPMDYKEGEMTIQEANKAVVRRYYRECFEKGDMAAIEACLAPEVLLHGREIRLDRKQLKDAFDRHIAAFPDGRFLIDHLVAEGDMVAANTRYTGTHLGLFHWADYGPWEPTGKSFCAREADFFRLEGGQIVEVCVAWERHVFVQQLGVVDRLPPPLGLPQPDATARANKAVVDRVFDEVYNGGNLDVVDELFAEDFALHMPGREVRGPDGVRDMVTVTRNGFPDIHFALEDAFAAGDRVVHRYTITGTHLADWHALPKTGKQVSGIQGYCVSRLVGGKVAEMWELDDSLSMLKQLGLVTLSAPMPSS